MTDCWNNMVTEGRLSHYVTGLVPGLCNLNPDATVRSFNFCASFRASISIMYQRLEYGPLSICLWVSFTVKKRLWQFRWRTSFRTLVHSLSTSRVRLSTLLYDCCARCYCINYPLCRRFGCNGVVSPAVKVAQIKIINSRATCDKCMVFSDECTSRINFDSVNTLRCAVLKTCR